MDRTASRYAERADLYLSIGDQLREPAPAAAQHLYQLAMQADRCAYAINDEDASEANLAHQAMLRILRGPAGALLADVALELERGGDSHRELGLALGELLDRDLERVEIPALTSTPEGKKEWVAVGVRRIYGPGGVQQAHELVRCPRHQETLPLSQCMECGRWDGIKFGTEAGTFILCRKD